MRRPQEAWAGRKWSGRVDFDDLFSGHGALSQGRSTISTQLGFLPSGRRARWLSAPFGTSTASVENLGGIAAVRSPAETDRFVRDQYQLYERLAERLGLRQ